MRLTELMGTDDENEELLSEIRHIRAKLAQWD
ncbi:hypothetical protein HPL003_15535 [Paenibacillus terrae HPL-003]|uniref:Uncharacterized protein n=1 Tax=Paenibacillus terrae (strain HPL-003) TaxID=985665 RepID=G7VXU5_PAETH|nr:hypothetical protein HPL003_15535 [Paenibacillus terrae HPL-003]